MNCRPTSRPQTTWLPRATFCSDTFRGVINIAKVTPQLMCVVLAWSPLLLAETTTPTGELGKRETIITSDTLELLSTERRFTYSGNVRAINGDLTITAASLSGRYSEKQEIEELVARGDVVITRGSDTRATSERAVYDAKRNTVTLTESPEITRQGSTVAADRIVLNLANNTSTAEGQVRVRALPQRETKP